MKDKVVIDSNILIYALNKSADEKHKKAKILLKRAEDKETAIPVQCLAETYFQVLKKDLEVDKAKKFLESIKHDRDFEILSYGSRELDSSMGVKTNFWDKMIEKTALESGYKAIYSENSSDFDEIEAVNPFPSKEWKKMAEEGMDLGVEKFDREEANER